MAKGIKRPYTVNVIRKYEDELGHSSETNIGWYDTWAVSKKQAVNNVRSRLLGNLSSQYMPVEIGGHYDVWFEYNAVEK